MSRIGRDLVSVVACLVRGVFSPEFVFKMVGLLGFGSVMFSIVFFREGDVLLGALLALVAAVLIGLTLTRLVGGIRHRLAKRKAALQAGTRKRSDDIAEAVIAAIVGGVLVLILFVLVYALVSMAS